MSGLREALDGPPGSMDAYLEVHSDSEIRADILALTTSKREHFAAMAMQGLLANSIKGPIGSPETFANAACVLADALIAELAKPVTP